MQARWTKNCFTSTVILFTHRPEKLKESSPIIAQWPAVLLLKAASALTRLKCLPGITMKLYYL